MIPRRRVSESDQEGEAMTRADWSDAATPQGMRVASESCERQNRLSPKASRRSQPGLLLPGFSPISLTLDF